MKANCLITVTIIVPLFVSVGCAPSGPKTIQVSGDVTFDGTPIAQGDIVFSAADGAQGGCAGKIVNGKYTIDSTLGSKKVEIRAMREVPGKMDESNPGESVPMQEMYIPAKYNTDTQLTAEVSESGETTFDFELESGS